MYNIRICFVVQCNLGLKVRASFLLLIGDGFCVQKARIFTYPVLYVKVLQWNSREKITELSEFIAAPNANERRRPTACTNPDEKMISAIR